MFILPYEEVAVQSFNEPSCVTYRHRRCAVCAECGLGAGPGEPFVTERIGCGADLLTHRDCCMCNKCHKVCPEKPVYIEFGVAYHHECQPQLPRETWM